MAHTVMVQIYVGLALADVNSDCSAQKGYHSKNGLHVRHHVRHVSDEAHVQQYRHSQQLEE